jgi:alkylation response protein AidB-like acyl-CoA dehydrogenase
MNMVENASEEQKREYLPRLATGKLLFAYGLSEPDVGGDLASAAVTARLSADGSKVIINGTKRWCTGARIADVIYTLVRSGPKEDRYKNLSLVLVPTTTRGISIVDIDHIGLRYSETTDVIFDDVEVPVANIVGGQERWNKGWPMLVGRGLDVERLEITAVALGIATAAMDDAWNYSQERAQFGRKICAHQAVRNMLVEAKTKLAACRHMLYHAAWLATAGRDCSVESSMAKLFVADNAVDIVLTCQRVMGAYGCAREYDMERYVRDIVCMPIVGGSSNMQKNNIASRLELPTR